MWGGERRSPKRLAYLRELRFFPVEVCLHGRRGRGECAEVAAKERSILLKGASGTAREGDISEPSPEVVIPVPFAGGGLECVDVSGDLTFGDIEINARPRAKLVD